MEKPLFLSHACIIPKKHKEDKTCIKLIITVCLSPVKKCTFEYHWFLTLIYNSTENFTAMYTLFACANVSVKGFLYIVE